MGYGSGEPDDYRKYSHYLSPESTWAAADVWAFGDSILNGARPQLTTRVNAAGATIAFDAWSARPSTPAVDALEDRLARPDLYGVPKVVLLVAFSNDITNPPVVASQVHRARALCELYGTQLVVVDTFVRREGYREADLINCGWINNQIHDTIAVDRIVHWHRLFASDKNRIAARLRDGIHPIDGQGDDFLAASILSVLGPLL